MSGDPEVLRAALRKELDYLWADLGGAMSQATNGSWSIECRCLEERIKEITMLVGPTPWDEIQLPLLESGVYQRIHADLGVEAPVDMDRVAKAQASLDAGIERARRGR